MNSLARIDMAVLVLHPEQLAAILLRDFADVAYVRIVLHVDVQLPPEVVQVPDQVVFWREKFA